MVPRRWKVNVPYSTIPNAEEAEGDEKVFMFFHL